MSVYHVLLVTNQTLNKQTASNANLDSPPKTELGVKNVQQPASPPQTEQLNVFLVNAVSKPTTKELNACLAQPVPTQTPMVLANSVQQVTFPTAKVPADATNALSVTKHPSIEQLAILATLVSSPKTDTAAKPVNQDTSPPTLEHPLVSHVPLDTEILPINLYAVNAQLDHPLNQERSVHLADLERSLNQEALAFLAQPHKVTLDLPIAATLVQQDQVPRKEAFACNAAKVQFQEKEDSVFHAPQDTNQTPINQPACHAHKDPTPPTERNVFLARLEPTQQTLVPLNAFHVHQDTLPTPPEPAAQPVHQDTHQWKEANVHSVSLDPQPNQEDFANAAQLDSEIPNHTQENVHLAKQVGVPTREEFVPNAQSVKTLIQEVLVKIVLQVTVPLSVVSVWPVLLVNLLTLVASA